MSTLWPDSESYISPPPGRDFQLKPCRGISLLGSTGSIGRNALAVIDASRGHLHVAALACGKNIELLAEQARKYRPKYLAAQTEYLAKKLVALLPADYRPKILHGRDGYALLASLEEADCVLSAQVGAAGLAATLAAALSGKVIALANKESLVLGGGLLRKICAASNASILPVDSEHHAIFQCAAGRGKDVASLILTASGGPFRGKSRNFLRNATIRDALNHPNWKMGAKITIDSATMMNKGLEIIEASALYGFSSGQIEVLIHPQSIVHSLARFRDNSLLAQLAAPDMRLPIANCLLWPHCQNAFIKPLDLVSAGPLVFEEPDEDVFIALKLARQALAFDSGPQWLEWGYNPACIALNAANEAAVEFFLNSKIGFLRIGEIVGQVLHELVLDNQPPAPPSEFPPFQNARDTEGRGKDWAARTALILASAIDGLDKKARQMADSLAETKN